MKTYPEYEISKVELKHGRVYVYLVAATTCGPRIEAQSATVPANSSDRAQVKATNEALRVAKRNLKAKHAAVVETCRTAGKHQGHGR